jgi:hypothetical protein
MKKLAETKALSELHKIKIAYQAFIKTNYEHRAADCTVCPTKGACCLDAHFVNVHVTRLEAAAIRKTLSKLELEKQEKIYHRAAETIEKYDLRMPGDTFQKTYACPLFEKNVGCLVHAEGKPTPCISHACYENQADLPPDALQAKIEIQIERLNNRCYGVNAPALPLPLWVDLISPFKNKSGQNNKESER